MIEAYGMTEAAHQMTSNPLGDGKQKAGCVGVVTSPEVCIMDALGALAAGGEGEVSAATMSRRAMRIIKANAESFTDGWFRTGDQGFFDANGYLKITGRLRRSSTGAAKRSRPGG